VQRHRARSDHYDLRLEVDGALVSWAVPKGPTLDPKARRTAFKVGDHPMEYLHFEGVIPQGQYGAGDVVVWDTGTWTPHGTQSTRTALDNGELHLDVFGHKLRGRLVLVRRGDPGEREQWLLVHKRDDDAVEGWTAGDHPRSVLSGRTNAEVAQRPERLWHSDLPAAEASVPAEPQDPRVEGPGEEALAELDAMGERGTWHVFGRSLKVTNLGKELFPGRDGEPPVTKRELLRYAACIAPVVLPYVEDRAINLRRHPEGAQTKGFWHKQRPDHAPEWVGAWDNPDADEGQTTTYAVLDEPAAVVWAAQFGALEWHPWTSRTDRPDRPTYALIDLDPGEETTWEDILVLARLHWTAFEHLGVQAFPKVTGSRGIQIWVPVSPGPGFEETRTWVEQLSRTVGAVVPELLNWKWEVRSRGGRARLDYTQNAINKTLVAPYSPRARPGAPVSAPISWDELDDDRLRPDGFTVRTMTGRIAERGDLFGGALLEEQTLPPLS
jgi:bifunctional non-homologous end joining protein LigD